MGFLTDLFGGSPDPEPFGGGFDPAIEEDAKYVLGKLKENVEKGLPEYVVIGLQILLKKRFKHLTF